MDKIIKILILKLYKNGYFYSHTSGKQLNWHKPELVQFTSKHAFILFIYPFVFAFFCEETFVCPHENLEIP